MIPNPDTLTKQLLNLVERIATEMKALFATVDTKLGKTDKAASAALADSVDWAGITNKPDFGQISTSNSVELCEQLIAFYNGLTGQHLDYRDFLDRPTSEILDAFYAYGKAYEETNV